MIVRGRGEMKEYLQRMGRSLMLPVATLPIAALFMGTGYWIDPNAWGANNVVAAFLIGGGSAILDNLGLLFAVGLALGMVNDRDGSSALSGLVAFLVPMALLNKSRVASFFNIPIEDVSIAFSSVNNGNVFFGILSGLIASGIYNKFARTKLPLALSFFSGRRLVPVLTAFAMLIVSAFLLFVWPFVFQGLTVFGEFISGMGALGAGLYGLFNRLLIPVGLHHALNNVFWFNLAGINDIGNFWANIGVKGITGMYQAGFFPVMMFGLPAGALAMYHMAAPEKKKSTASLMLAAGFASFFTGVTEPLEFSFMFVAWPLYVVHAALTGLSLFVASTLRWTAGFNFSAGLIDFILSLRSPMANKPYMLLIQGCVVGGIYYGVFRYVILYFKLMTPGREVNEEEKNSMVSTLKDEKNVGISSTSMHDDRTTELARKLYQSIGGKENVVFIDNCATRLRITVKSSRGINEADIKKSGAIQGRIVGAESVQIIIGPEVQFVADAMNILHKG